LEAIGSAGYSIYNAIFIGLICFAGFMPLVLATVPLEAGVGVVLWIGIIITAQAFQATPKEHAPAVAIGLFPAVAAWGLLMINNSLSIADLKMEDVVAAYEGAGTRILGMIHLSQGFILACMIWSAAAVAIVEKKFATAAVWMGSAAVLSCVGLIHAFQFQGGFVANKFGMLAAPKFAAAYGFLAVLFYLFGKIQRGGSGGGAPLAPG
jgi:AGZA family xanthine/uracil permease-like MFS transporter